MLALPYIASTNHNQVDHGPNFLSELQQMSLFGNPDLVAEGQPCSETLAVSPKPNHLFGLNYTIFVKETSPLQIEK